MGLASIGVPSLILILVIALLIFGPKKLPEFGSAVGTTLKEFKKSTNELMDDEPDSDKPENTNIENKEDNELNIDNQEDNKN